MVAEAGEAVVLRFGATERRLHMIHASAFFVMFATGLVLYLPMLAQIVSSRPVVKAIHLTAAVAWLTALALVAILGDRRALRRTRREIERLDADDLLWLRNSTGFAPASHRLRTGFAPASQAQAGTGRRRQAQAGTGGAGAPQGRFNAGQKLHAVVQAALAVLFTVSGVLLWLGERDTAWRLPGTIALHDVSMLIAGVLVAGHVWMAISPQGLPAIHGILRGTVPAAWAAEHHPKWVPDAACACEAGAPEHGPGRAGPVRLAAAGVVVALGLAGISVLVFT